MAQEDITLIADRIRGALDEALDRKKELEEALSEVNREVKRLKYFLSGTADGIRKQVEEAANHVTYRDVLAYLANHPGMDKNEIGKALEMSPKRVGQILSYQKKQGVVTSKPKKAGYRGTGNLYTWSLAKGKGE